VTVSPRAGLASPKSAILGENHERHEPRETEEEK
jgi:hypothetical protein